MVREFCNWAKHGIGSPVRNRGCQAFVRHFNHDEPGHIFLDSDDGSDVNEDREDNMDPLTFARYYVRAGSNPHFVEMVKDHDRETRA